jgi:hypothetical protein
MNQRSLFALFRFDARFLFWKLVDSLAEILKHMAKRLLLRVSKYTGSTCRRSATCGFIDALPPMFKSTNGAAKPAIWHEGEEGFHGLLSALCFKVALSGVRNA